MSKRDRSRECAGKSERSHIKHDLIKRVVGAQLGAFRLKNKGRILLIDGNAGDGHGVEQPQSDLFGDNPSCATAELLVGLAANDGNVDVVLCEADSAKRLELSGRFPDATVIEDHAFAPSHLRKEHIHALWLSDPCGPAHHGVAAMRAIANRVTSDFVIALNEHAIKRILGTNPYDLPDGHPSKKPLITSRDRYGSMIDPSWWMNALNRRRLARTINVINGAPNFQYRILVVANVLSQGATRHPFEEVCPCEAY